MRIASRTLALLIIVASCSDSTAPPGLPASLRLSSSASVSAVVGDTLAPIVVEVRDANGRGVPNVPVVALGIVQGPQYPGFFYSTASLDSITTTDASGRASMRLIMPKTAGSGTITVDVGNVPISQSVAQTGLIPLSIPFTAAAGHMAQLIPHPAQRFSGATFSIDSLFTPADKYGNVVSASSPQATATNGWHVNANALTPPTASYVGTTVLTATSGGVTGTDTVSVVDDLRLYHWRFGWTCASTPAEVAAGAPDSVVASGRNGVAIYPSDPGFRPIMGHTGVGALFVAVEFKFTGTMTSYRNGVATGNTDIMAGETYGWDMMSQHPDAVVFGVDTYSRVLARVPGALPSFVSPTGWCSGTTLQGVSLTAY